MTDQASPDVGLLHAAYAAFDTRDIDAAQATMASDVTWPKAFKVGFAHGQQEFRAYRMEQWSEIDPRVQPTSFHPEAAGGTLVHVHQFVRDLAGTIIADGHVGHRFTIDSGLISGMEVCSLSPPNHGSWRSFGD